MKFKQIDLENTQDKIREICWIPSQVAIPGRLLEIEGITYRISSVFAGGEYDENEIRHVLFNNSKIYPNVRA
jgi:hypothetical protein